MNTKNSEKKQVKKETRSRYSPKIQKAMEEHKKWFREFQKMTPEEIHKMMQDYPDSPTIYLDW